MNAKILIVEDELLVAMEMEAVIEDHGHTPVGIATTAAEARRIVAEAQPDVALVDLHLADGLTGPDIGRELAARGITVVFVTANPRLVADDLAGALGVVEKPVGEDAVIDVLSYAIAMRGGASVPPPKALRPR